jgi:DHA1 family bicyclomycin/chloramphenicol resistance-like MFS transporter
MSTRQSLIVLLLLLGGPASVYPLALDVAVPTISDMAVSLGTDPSGVLLGLSGLALGAAIGQLFFGPMSDRFGRKPMLLAGLIVYAAAAGAIAFAPGVGVMIGFRFVQGLAISNVMSTVRAIVRDRFDGHDAARMYAYILTVLTLFPIFGPPIGGYLSELAGWQTVFYIMAGLTLSFAALDAVFLRETVAAKDLDALSPGALARRYAETVRNPDFRIYMAIMIPGYAGMFTLIAGIEPVLRGFLLETPGRIGIEFAITMSSAFFAALIGGKLISRIGIPRMIVLGAAICFVSAAGGLILALAGIAEVWAIVVPGFFFMFGDHGLHPDRLGRRRGRRDRRTRERHPDADGHRHGDHHGALPARLRAAASGAARACPRRSLRHMP